jgi:D-alanine-D-alanine ligase
MSVPTLALVFGGASPEHEVSLVSAQGILENLDTARYELVLVGVDREGRPRVGDRTLLTGGLDHGGGTPVRWPAWPGDRTLREETSGRPVTPPLDVAFPIIHGATGEDGVLQGVLRWAGVRLVGSDVLGSSLAMDKDRARRVLASAGLPVVDDLVLIGSQTEEVEAARARVPESWYPLFVKPARAGSSVGITKVAMPEGFAAALARARAVDPDKIVVERAVREPREMEVAVLGGHEPEASPAGEILPHGEFYTYEAKYEDPESQLLVPAPLEEERVRELQELARRAFVALELWGLARVDFLLGRADGSVVVNEVNTLPGFTPISMYPRLWEAGGVPFTRLLDRLIALAR